MTTIESPKADIIGAATPGDVIRAAEADPALKSVLIQGLTSLLTNQSLIGTRTFWVALVTPFISFGVARLGFGLDETTCAEIAAGIVSVAMVVMRTITKTPVTSVLPTTTPTL